MKLRSALAVYEREGPTGAGVAFGEAARATIIVHNHLKTTEVTELVKRWEVGRAFGSMARFLEKVDEVRARLWREGTL